MCSVLQLLFIVCLLFIGSDGDRTSLKIYENLQSDIFCFRRLNSTHQIGCSSKRNGNIGVVHVVEDTEELQNVTSEPLHSSYVIALPISLFNMGNMTLLKKAQGIQGVIILYEKKQFPKLFSPEQSCPNRNFGFYTEAMNPKYAACKRVQWNRVEGNLALGMMYEDWGMPIFILTNETSIKHIRRCYEKFNKPENGTAKPWPLCSVQLNSVMLGAKDSDTCMRRRKVVADLNQVKTCDPLSDKNIVTTLFPTNKSEEVANKSVIVLSCRLDSFSMFDRLAPGAHSTVTGLVTLLTIAKTMAAVREDIESKVKDQKNILFSIFNGEAFDYIGSSRIVFDMQKGVFPVTLSDDIEDQPAPLGLHHISHFIELSQLVPQDSVYWVHADPVSSENPTVAQEVSKLFDLLRDATERLSKRINVTRAGQNLPLPPASFQSFLRHEINIPGIVLADHEKEFKNRYYNSIFDTDESLHAPMLPQMLTDLATVVSNMLYTMLTGEENPNLEADEELVTGLLECYLRNASCDLFRQIADPSMTERLRVEPYPLYISVHTGEHTKANAITLYTRYMLAYLTGSILSDRVRENCTSDTKTQIDHYDWMTGPDANTSGICVKSTVMYTLAESPANELDDWKSNEYSTWTESVWLETSVRIFLQPSKEQEIATFVTGIIIFLFSIASVYFTNKRASIIFNTKPLFSC